MVFLSFAKNVIKNIGKILSKRFSNKYSQKLVDHAKKFTTDTFRPFSKTVIQVTAEFKDLIGNKIDIKITKV